MKNENIAIRSVIIIVILVNVINGQFSNVIDATSTTNSNNNNKILSPCPQLFQYRFDGQQWFGILEIPSPQVGQTVKLNIKMSLRAQLPTVNFIFIIFFGKYLKINLLRFFYV